MGLLASLFNKLLALAFFLGKEVVAFIILFLIVAACTWVSSRLGDHIQKKYGYAARQNLNAKSTDATG
jgi:hypothetical protein